mgnify:CR=1 FL=1
MYMEASSALQQDPPVGRTFKCMYVLWVSMVNVTVALNAEDHARLAEICRKLNMTIYSFTLDALMKALHLEEARDPGGKVVSEKALALVAQLKDRKWHLYQMADYSDKNHRDWLAGRNPNCTKREVQLAVALFRGGGIE